MNTTQQYQYSFAAHLRDPLANPVPAGVDPQRMDVYAHLLFNNVQDFLSGCFPVLHGILSIDEWNGLVRRFYAEHACQTPYFREIPSEFVQWLSGRFTSLPLRKTYPFLLELAHYEWVEVPLLLDDSDVDWDAATSDGDWLDGKLLLNPVMLLQTYQYPVHTLSAETLPIEPRTTHLLLLRNRAGKVDFIELNDVTARLLQLLPTHHTARAALTRLADEMAYPDPQQLLVFGVQILQQLQAQQAIVGVFPGA
jgi:hypothetical protein